MKKVIVFICIILCLLLCCCSAKTIEEKNGYSFPNIEKKFSHSFAPNSITSSSCHIIKTKDELDTYLASNSDIQTLYNLTIAGTEYEAYCTTEAFDTTFLFVVIDYQATNTTSTIELLFNKKTDRLCPLRRVINDSEEIKPSVRVYAYALNKSDFNDLKNLYFEKVVDYYYFYYNFMK
ncbi:MAG: hypothetical protein K5923_04200 [Clostridia bacterium]|nr:hypothetical protein [Clostridia bacterium]